MRHLRSWAFGRNRRLPVFPKVDAASPRGVMAPPGLTALGCQGSVRDRLTPPGRVEGSALGRYEVPFHWGGTAPSAPFFIPPLAAKTIQPPCGRGNAFPPLWWLAPPPCPVGSMSLDSRVAYSSPMNPVPLPPPQAGAQQPMLTVELLMKRMIRGVLFCPACGGSPAQPERGRRAQQAKQQNAY